MALLYSEEEGGHTTDRIVEFQFWLRHGTERWQAQQEPLLVSKGKLREIERE
jgi:hypothetical protein